MPRPKGVLLSPYEKEVLIDLVENNKIVESKCNNAKVLFQKEEAWKEIVSSFNSRMGVTQRTEKQLKDLWKNINARAKGQVAAVRRSMAKTGGGLNDEAVDTFTEKVFSMLPQQIQSFSNPYDDDAEFHQDEQVEMVILNSTSGGACGGPTDVIVQPGDYTHRQRVAEETTETTGLFLCKETTKSACDVRNMTSSQSYVTEKRKSKSDITKPDKFKEAALSLAEKEHRQRMNFMAEEHKLKMEMLEEDRARKRELYELKKETLQMKREKLQSDSSSLPASSSSLSQKFWQLF
ncbi:myb/SANT-like DNA-binding domain-containing protein 3 [Mercenaria mercenaria]|uniref:myb/SANT-like DNA-binding domain-containing protein 3 n=1 Tax=Mercenaria mercenaria TaxID=6596 RepID=UPI00234F7AA2|nr:myb/SANT-like DNA-binding domain-containing protein 3 [Mercenaria mercenaria]